jgi:hypothetical protein
MNTEENNTQSSQSSVSDSAFKYSFNHIDYIETLAEELVLNGFNVKVVKETDYSYFIEYDTIFGKMKYKQSFNNVMKDYYRFIMCYGMRLQKYGLEKHLSVR